MKYSFKIGERVALYRKETNPLNGDIRKIPEVGSIGTIFNIPYFHEDFNCYIVDVNWGDKWWMVRCCNLKRVKAEAVNKFFPVVAEKPKKQVFESPLEKLVFLEAKCKHDNLNSYYYRGNGDLVFKIDDICYASALNCDKLNEFAMVYPQLEGKEDYIDWVLNESIFADAFNCKNAEEFLKKGSILDCSYSKYYVIGSACALRQAYEYENFYNAWKLAVDNGVDKHVAFLVATMFKDSFEYNRGSGHTVIMQVSTNQKDFVKKKWNKKATSINTMFHSPTWRGEEGCLVETAIEKLGYVSKDNYGYKTYNKLSKDEYLSVCRNIEEELMK